MNKSKLSGFAATPADLRQIVLSYLCDNCYAEAAQVFARDSAMRELDKDGDEVLTSGEDEMLDVQIASKVQCRKEIKIQILSGQIDEAVEMLRLHYPTVLTQSGYINDASRYDPAHLFLNLRIQNFIEQSRTMSLPWPSDILTSSHPATQQSPSVKFGLFSGTGSSEEELRKDRLLKLMHELYMLAHALSSPMDRETYLKELSTVGGLLAYPIPEKSREMRKYLDMKRREAVADQINEALLYRSNVHLPGIVDLSVRHATLLFATLNSLGRRLPPSELRPSGVETMLSWDPQPMLDTKGHKAAKEKGVQEAFPTFNLQKFLGPEPT